MELPGRLAILPFRNKVLLPGAIIRIRCTSSSRYFRFFIYYYFLKFVVDVFFYCCFQNLDNFFFFFFLLIVWWLWLVSVKLVEQELWQREEKGLIGILPVRDAAAETSSAGSPPSPGD